MTALAPHLCTFLREYLVDERGCSIDTCETDTYSFQLLAGFAAAVPERSRLGHDALGVRVRFRFDLARLPISAQLETNWIQSELAEGVDHEPLSIRN